jgi:ABC-type branched-subunit amino acid transport system permease subunit
MLLVLLLRPRGLFGERISASSSRAHRPPPRHRRLALVLLPFALSVIGLGVTSATEVVVFALACMALNILVGYTGLTSFGHGAWFGLAAYAAGMSQRDWFAGSFFMPLALGLAIVVVLAAAFGFLILRRRGVYFSLLTLALSAMLYSVAFRWTDVTGGENGLGGITRPSLLGVSFENAATFYALVASVAFVALLALWRFHRSPFGSVLVAIRENEQRARFLGYPTDRVKLAAFVTSAGLTGLAGMLLAFNNRMTSAEPISVGLFRRAAGHGRDRRHAFVSRSCARRAVLRDLSRLAVARHRELAACLRAAVRGLRRLFADRPGRPVRTSHRALAKAAVGEAAMAQRLAGTVTLARLSCAAAGHGDVILKPRVGQAFRRHPRGEEHVAAACATGRCTR